jgi:hypothetical protein
MHGIARTLLRPLVKSIRAIEKCLEAIVPGGMEMAEVAGFDQGYVCKAAVVR